MDPKFRNLLEQMGIIPKDPLREILGMYVEMIGGALVGVAAAKEDKEPSEKEQEEITKKVIEKAKEELTAICENIFGNGSDDSKITKTDKIRLFHTVHARCAEILATAL